MKTTFILVLIKQRRMFELIKNMFNFESLKNHEEKFGDMSGEVGHEVARTF